MAFFPNLHVNADLSKLICHHKEGGRVGDTEKRHLFWFKGQRMKWWWHYALQFSSGHLVMSDSVTPWVAARQASLSITNSWSLLKLMPIESVMPSSHLILCRPLLLLPPIPLASGSFLTSQLFPWSGQSTGVSASVSVLPMRTQDLSPSGWTGWISLQSKGLSSVFYNTIVQKHEFFSAQLSSQSNSHIHIWPLEKP